MVRRERYVRGVGRSGCGRVDDQRQLRAHATEMGSDWRPLEQDVHAEDGGVRRRRRPGGRAQCLAHCTDQPPTQREDLIMMKHSILLLALAAVSCDQGLAAKEKTTVTLTSVAFA